LSVAALSRSPPRQLLVGSERLCMSLLPPALQLKAARRVDRAHSPRPGRGPGRPRKCAGGHAAEPGTPSRAGALLLCEGRAPLATSPPQRVRRLANQENQ
jgi:hypothetical protein